MSVKIYLLHREEKVPFLIHVSYIPNLILISSVAYGIFITYDKFTGVFKNFETTASDRVYTIFSVASVGIVLIKVVKSKQSNFSFINTSIFHLHQILSMCDVFTSIIKAFLVQCTQKSQFTLTFTKHKC